MYIEIINENSSFWLYTFDDLDSRLIQIEIKKCNFFGLGVLNLLFFKYFNHRLLKERRLGHLNEMMVWQVFFKLFIDISLYGPCHSRRQLCYYLLCPTVQISSILDFFSFYLFNCSFNDVLCNECLNCRILLCVNNIASKSSSL